MQVKFALRTPPQYPIMRAKFTKDVVEPTREVGTKRTTRCVPSQPVTCLTGADVGLAGNVTHYRWVLLSLGDQAHIYPKDPPK